MTTLDKQEQEVLDVALQAALKGDNVKLILSAGITIRRMVDVVVQNVFPDAEKMPVERVWHIVRRVTDQVRVMEAEEPEMVDNLMLLMSIANLSTLSYRIDERVEALAAEANKRKADDEHGE